MALKKTITKDKKKLNTNPNIIYKNENFETTNTTDALSNIEL